MFGGFGLFRLNGYNSNENWDVIINNQLKCRIWFHWGPLPPRRKRGASVYRDQFARTISLKKKRKTFLFHFGNCFFYCILLIHSRTQHFYNLTHWWNIHKERRGKKKAEHGKLLFLFRAYWDYLILSFFFNARMPKSWGLIDLFFNKL